MSGRQDWGVSPSFPHTMLETLLDGTKGGVVAAATVPTRGIQGII